MDNLLTDKDLDTIARAHHRCGEMEIERTLGALRVRVSTCPASRAWSVPYLIRLERWRPGLSGGGVQPVRRRSHGGQAPGRPHRSGKTAH